VCGLLVSGQIEGTNPVPSFGLNAEACSEYCETMSSKLERLYPFVPVFVQNLGKSLIGLAWRHERLGGRFEEYVAAFQEHERWPVDRFHHYVERELRHVLLYAFALPYVR
jgi:hypothetical protein